MAPATNINIVTYNVLSSHLGGTDYFTSCDPNDLDQKIRYKRITKFLEEEIKKSSIICLQEVSTLWVGRLHAFFAARGYYLITANYGKKFNGYMGVATAVPLKLYEIVDTDIATICDTKSKPKLPPSATPSFITRIFNTVFQSVFTFFTKLFIKPVENLWSIALGRTNQLIALRLRSLETKKTFVVGNYHMPCIYDKPQVMMIHTALSLQYLQGRAQNDPLIYCGDFNCIPTSAMYKLVTEAAVSEDQFLPPKYFHDDVWSVTSNIRPMKSAYMVKDGREPDFTNFSKVKEDPTFIETLDYIFLSTPHSWKIKNVSNLPSKVEMDLSHPFPSADQPSDHLMLTCELQIE